MYQLLTQSIKRTTYVTYICIALLCLGLLGSGAPYVSAATTTISGTVYSDLGETAVGAGKTVGVAVQGKDAFTHISEVSGNGDAYSVAWNGDYIAVGSNWSQVRLYERSGSTLTYRDTVSTNGEAQDVDWNGDYLAVAHSGGNNVTTFKLNRGSLVQVTPRPNKRH